MIGAFAFITDITELLQIEGSVAKYTSELERSTKELKEFAYIVSYNLQKPLRPKIAISSIAVYPKIGDRTKKLNKICK